MNPAFRSRTCRVAAHGRRGARQSCGSSSFLPLSGGATAGLVRVFGRWRVSRQGLLPSFAKAGALGGDSLLRHRRVGDGSSRCRSVKETRVGGLDGSSADAA